MCRAALYLGKPVRLGGLLYDPDNALVHQSYAPRQLGILNLAGFGMHAWLPGDDEATPLSYRTTALPFYDANLRSMARKLDVRCALAHVRGIPLRPEANFGEANVHPFRYPGYRWSTGSAAPTPTSTGAGASPRERARSWSPRSR